MKIYITEQTKNLNKHLDLLKSKSVMSYDKTKLIEKITINTKAKIENIDLQFLFDYKIFPNKIMTYFTEWNVGKRKMKVGDTIVQQVYLPPIKSFSQKIIFGVRINEIIDEPFKKGFSYETLEGHVEKGISTFTLEQNETETVCKILTYSIPGNILTKLLGPIFSIPYQSFCTRSAMENIKYQIERTNA